jgi:hypothetical protein
VVHQKIVTIARLDDVSTYTKLIVYFMIRLIGRLKPGLHKQSLPSETEEIQRAQAGFVCADRGFNRPVFFTGG